MDVDFRVDRASPIPAATPTMAVWIEIQAKGQFERVHSVLLRCQLQIDTLRRRYSAREQEKLVDLFGDPSIWGRTLKPLPWIQTQLVVPGFAESTGVELLVPCTLDFQVAATRYFEAMEGGEVPLRLLFSGTIFFATEQLGLQVAQIPWEKEATWRLPHALWRTMMDQYYPHGVWLSLPRAVFERLDRFRRESAAPSLERALENLLDQAEVRT